MEARNGQGGHAKETERASAVTTQREFQRTGTPTLEFREHVQIKLIEKCRVLHSFLLLFSINAAIHETLIILVY